MSLVSRLLDPTLVEHLNHMQLSARSVVQGSTIGQHRSPVRGSSVEFRQHRFYVAGDEPRRLDWRVLARTDRPYVKEYDEETNLRCVIALDASGSMAYDGQHGSKFEYATRLAAAFSYLMLSQTESVGIAICGHEIDPFIAPHTSASQLARLIDALEIAVPSGASGIARSLHEIADRMDRRSLVIVLSDFFVPVEPLRKGLAHLRHERHEVLAVQVLDRHEQEFPFQTWVRMRGLEGEPARVIEPAMARRLYVDNFRRHQRLLHEASLAMRVEFQEILTSRPLLDSVKLLLSRHNSRQSSKL